MSNSVEIILKGYFKYYNPSGEKIYLEITDRYMNRLESCMPDKNVKFLPYKKYKNCNTVYIKNTKQFPVNIIALEGQNIVIRCRIRYYEFKDKYDELITGYKVEARKAQLLKSP